MTEWKVNSRATEVLRKQAPPGLGDSAYAYDKGELSAIVTRDDIAGIRAAKPDRRWHISVIHSERVPTWDELVDAAHSIRPGVVFVIGVPPRSWWMNVHPNALHLWEVRDSNLAEQWFAERQGHAPTKGGRR